MQRLMEETKTNKLSENDDYYYSQKDYYEELKVMIQNLEVDNKYIIYDRKARKFVYNEKREKAIEYCKNQDKIWKNAKGNYRDIVQQWYDEAFIHDYESKKDRIRRKFNEYWNSRSIKLKTLCTSDNFQVFVDRLSEIFEESIAKREDVINKKLKMVCDYRVARLQKNNQQYYYFYHKNDNTVNQNQASKPSKNQNQASKPSKSNKTKRTNKPKRKPKVDTVNVKTAKAS